MFQLFVNVAWWRQTHRLKVCNMVAARRRRLPSVALSLISQKEV